MDELVVNVIDNIILEIESEQMEPPRRQRGNETDPFEMRDAAFKKNFRLNKTLARDLINIIEPVIVPRTNLDLSTKVLCALNFFGTGSYQTPVGNLKDLNLSQPSTSRCISEVVDALNHPIVFNQWVKFPNTLNELNSLTQGFYRTYNFPGVIGCIDCTHVAIVPPIPPFEECIYVNRKNYHSVNTQLICDSNLKILNVNALFPGSTHDSYIWRNSNVLPFLENLHAAGYSNYHLIGDSGYPLRPWCLTPILQAAVGTPAARYNDCLKTTRATIERCNGVLKGRFRCLLIDRVMHYTPNKATKIINACCVLHNLCVAHNYNEAVKPVDDIELLGFLNEPIAPQHPAGRDNDLLLGRQKQMQIINTYFNN